MRTVQTFVLLLTAILGINPCSDAVAMAATRLQINVNDAEGTALPCRVHLVDSQGRPQHAAGQPAWRDHFVCGGRVGLDLKPGAYEYAVERGPEFERLHGKLAIQSDKPQTLDVTLKRIAHLRKANWYSGDLHVHRPVRDIELLMQAEDLDFAPVVTWWNKKNLWDGQDLPTPVVRRFDGHRLTHIMAGEDEREGGALMYYGLDRPIEIRQATREVPSPMTFVALARKQNPAVWIDIEKPFWWDVPVWIASGQMNSIGLANNHMCRSRMYESEAWGKPRDVKRLPNPTGNGFWTQEIYYHILEAGLRLPPSAGSASGVLPNPVGYNRVYVNLDDVGGKFTHENWWKGLAAGRSFVTNGPILLCRADDELPGTVFQRAGTAAGRIRLTIQLTTLDRIPRVEIVQNGKVVQSLDCQNVRSQELTTEIDRTPGWFLVRAIADNPKTFRFASSAPFYVQSEGQPRRISAKACGFFLDWVNERIERITKNVADLEQRREVLAYHEEARTFWETRLSNANAD